MNMFKGLQTAMIAQVPYTVIMMSMFEGLTGFIESDT